MLPLQASYVYMSAIASAIRHFYMVDFWALCRALPLTTLETLHLETFVPLLMFSYSLIDNLLL